MSDDNADTSMGDGAIETLGGQSTNANESVEVSNDEVEQNDSRKPGSKEEGESEKAVEQKPTRRVGFAEAPVEDLRDHHLEIRRKEEERKKYNPFHKIAPEFSYLEKRAPAPRKIPTAETPKRRTSSTVEYQPEKASDTVYVKDFSVQNKETEMNFHFPSLKLPLPVGTVLVDVKYVTFDSFDLLKMSHYLLNVSSKKVVFGHQYVGNIMSVSKSLSNGPYQVGDRVFGITDPLNRKGTLSSALLINPKTDVMIKVDKDTEARLADLEVQLNFERISNDDEFSIGDETSADDGETAGPESTLVPHAEPDLADTNITIPPLAKLAVFPLHYCRAKQVLERCDDVIRKSGRANILINGADTNLGLMLVQLLTSSLYSEVLAQLNLILVIKEANKPRMEGFMSQVTQQARYDTAGSVRFKLLTFDLQNDSIVLPKERIPVNYKKPNFFAAELIDALFESHKTGDPLVSKTSINDYKLDLIADLVGSKMFLQKTSISYTNIGSMNLPFRAKIDPAYTVADLFKEAVKEPFLVKLLKPKAAQSAFVSCCDFNLREPTYAPHLLFADAAPSSFNLYSSNWAASVANNSMFAKYNYHDERNLRVSGSWVDEGLALLLKREIRVKIDGYQDWRSNIKACLQALKANESSVVLKIEDF